MYKHMSQINEKWSNFALSTKIVDLTNFEKIDIHVAGFLCVQVSTF
jgi:hypothetical protein